MDCPSPSELVERVLARLDGRGTGPLGVLDPSWPAALLRQGREDLADAVAHGRLRDDELVLFTSGSSGRPRAVVRSVESWRASLEPLSELSGIGSDVTGPVWVPGALTSSLFLYGAVHAAWSGLPWTTGRADSAAAQAAEAAHVVPTQLADALDARERGQLPRLRTVVVAGAHLPRPLHERATRHGLRVLEYYGAAELSFVGWRDEPGPFRTFPGAEIRLDETARLWVRSPYVARSYLRRAECGPWLRRDGWCTVGDLARGDSGGWWVVGRGDAAVTSGGHTVLVAEVETVLRDVSGVADVVVLGLPHERLGEIVVAVICLEGSDTSLRHRLERAVRSLPGPSRPRRWLRCDELPRIASGKVDRTAVRQRAPALPRLT